MLDPPAAAESTQNPATETIRNIVLPRRKPFLKKTNDGNHKELFTATTETIHITKEKTMKTIKKKKKENTKTQKINHKNEIEKKTKTRNVG